MRGTRRRPDDGPETGGALPLRPCSAPADGRPSVCPHCWMVNPGPFRLCVRCGAEMETFLQESGGLRRTAPIQSPVPAPGGPPLSRIQRIVVGIFLVVLVLSQLARLAPPRPIPAASPEPAPGAGL